MVRPELVFDLLRAESLIAFTKIWNMPGWVVSFRPNIWQMVYRGEPLLVGVVSRYEYLVVSKLLLIEIDVREITLVLSLHQLFQTPWTGDVVNRVVKVRVDTHYTHSGNFLVQSLEHFRDLALGLRFLNILFGFLLFLLWLLLLMEYRIFHRVHRSFEIRNVVFVHTAATIQMPSVPFSSAFDLNEAAIEIVNAVVSVHGCVLSIDVIDGWHGPDNFTVLLLYAVFLFINSLELLWLLYQSLRGFPWRH